MHCIQIILFHNTLLVYFSTRKTTDNYQIDKQIKDLLDNNKKWVRLKNLAHLIYIKFNNI